MTAMALRWEGKDRGVSVSKVESVDPGAHVYRASARFDGIDYLVDVWLGMDGGKLRLKVFDNDGRPAGLSLVQSTPASAFTGIWRRSEPRTAHDFGHGLDADTDTEETLVIAIGTDGAANITHRIQRHVYFTGAKRAACGGSKLELGLEQSFEGTLQDASIVGIRKADARAAGADMPRCWSLFTYAPDQQAVLKRIGDRLAMYHGPDGAVYPEAAEFER